MSAYEKFVEQAAEVAYNSGAVVWWWDQLTPNERQPRIDRMRAALDVVGPLIAEDARDRMVAAAKVAVEREGGVEWKAIVVPCAACAAGKPGEVDLFAELDKMADDEDEATP